MNNPDDIASLFWYTLVAGALSGTNASVKVMFFILCVHTMNEPRAVLRPRKSCLDRFQHKVIRETDVKGYLPGVLHDKTEVVRRGKFDSCLNILRGAGIHTNNRDAPLRTWKGKGCVQVTRTNGAIWEYVCLEVG